MAERRVTIDGIDYSTLLDKPENGNGQYVLLCHALMSNMHMWDKTVEALTKAGYTTLRFDHVGHNSTPAPEDASFSLHMDDITRHMHQLVQEITGQPHIKAFIGCSIGGVLALRYAMIFPQDVEKVISIAAPGITTPEVTKELWSQRIQQFEEDERTGGDKLCHGTVQRWFPGQRAEDDAVRAESLKHVKTCSLRGYKILADTIRDYDYAEDVRNIKKEVQCLVVAGSEDSAVSPGVLKDLTSKIPNAKYIRMEGAGHLPPMHKAEEFNALAVDFIS